MRTRDRSAPEPADLILTHGTIITMNQDRRVLTDGAIAVRAGRIIAVGDTAEILAGHQAVEQIDCHKGVVLPGLIDAHGHGGHALLKTIGVDTLSWWMRIATRVYFDQTSVDYWRADGALAALERVRFGVTTGVSVLGSQPRSDIPEFGGAHAQSYAESGMRLILGVGPAGRPWPRQVGWWDHEGHHRREVGLTEMMAGAEETIRRWNGTASGRVRVCVTPYTMVPSLNPSGPLPPDQTLELDAADLEHSEHVRDLARRYATRIHTDAFGGMVRLGHAKDPNALLGPDVHFQHGFGLAADEVSILRDTGTAVTHGPGVVIGALRGRCPVPELLDAGVTVAITTDGCAPMSSFDLFAAMRQAQALTQLQTRDVYQLPPGKLLEMVTIDAARAIGWEDEIGSLEVGKAADIVVVDTDQAHLQPLHMPVHAIVYKASGSDVSTVIVAGRVLMKDRIMQIIDARQVLESAAEEASRVIERGNLQPFITGPQWGRSRQEFSTPVPFD